MRNPAGLSDFVDIVALEHCGFAALPSERTLEDGPWVLRMAGAWPNEPTPPTRAPRAPYSMRIV